MQCEKCASFDVGRIKRKLWHKFYIRRIYLCNQCGWIHKQKK